MTKQTRQRWVVAIVAVFGLITVGGIAVAAPNTRAEDAKAAAQQRQLVAQQTAADNREAAQTKLADAKLKACQNREKAINNILARIASRGQKQLDLFSTIATRVETFYTDKGKVLSNYDALVADVNAKAAAAQTAVDAVKAASVTFKCDGTDPKGTAQSFKDSLKAEIAALKDYKSAVKNLIVGVKSVQGTSSSAENSQSGGQQ